MKKLLYFSLLLTAFLSSAQTYTWQWAQYGGGNDGSWGSGYIHDSDEKISAI